MKFNKAFLAKAAGWLLSAVGILAAGGAFGKYTPFANGLIALLAGAGIHVASNTSAGHPNG